MWMGLDRVGLKLEHLSQQQSNKTMMEQVHSRLKNVTTIPSSREPIFHRVFVLIF
jgi:hypothetical protein